MTYKKDREVVMREVAGEKFLIPVRNRLADMRNIYVLHGIGEFIWTRLDDDTDAICEAIVSEYEVEHDQAMRDLEDYLQELLEADLISAHRDDSTPV